MLTYKRRCQRLALTGLFCCLFYLLLMRTDRRLHPDRYVIPSPHLAVQPITGYNLFDRETGIERYLKPRDHEVSPLPRLLISPTHACRESSFFVVLSICRADAVYRRKVIRDTWASAVKSGNWPGPENLSVSGDVVFVLGSSESRFRQRQVEAEARQHGDMIVGDFTDTYNNLTRKTLTGLNWVARNCLHARFVVKQDEDTYMDYPRLVRFLLAHENSLRDKIIGKLYFNSKPFRSGKWEMTQSEYPFSVYPKFANGPCYLLSTSIVHSIVIQSRFLPQLHLEDVAVTGLIAESLGIERLHMEQIHSINAAERDLCVLVGKERYQITLTNLSSEEMQLLWRIISSGRCLSQFDAT